MTARPKFDEDKVEKATIKFWSNERLENYVIIETNEKSIDDVKPKQSSWQNTFSSMSVKIRCLKAIPVERYVFALNLNEQQIWDLNFKHEKWIEIGLHFGFRFMQMAAICVEL